VLFRGTPIQIWRGTILLRFQLLSQQLPAENEKNLYNSCQVDWYVDVDSNSVPSEYETVEGHNAKVGAVAI
jgi:hypothetical protein